ncbi:MAG: magnesium transporter [Candidatus Aenigmatarchaeota archaeon]
MQFFDKGFMEIFSSQMFSIIGGIIAGTILAVYTDRIILLPGMLILLPGFLEMRGNISGSLASRLSSGMFLGVIKPSKMWTKLTKGNLTASFFLAIFIAFVLGVIAYVFNMFVLGLAVPEIILISVTAAILANAIEIPITFLFTFYLFRKGHDPNNVMGPFVTTTGDLTSVVALLIALVLI